ncbi:HpcH/HpaI aldolase/citrate lyase family protein [Halocalculus aciditolerans]|uniref:Citrate lyase subunit beta n=1 Tax=Halocalculus aciditolerans TaxID=1383812 RepID=A0A830FL08_9EURY|nr:CoA ester lyase [Halocalculus aciditolerans]GGL66257.1 citrate lyase subunit beta [Halocalculus aciditolerans]
MTNRLRRSFLYTPADDAGMMRKAAESNADAIIFDLEDAIPTDAIPAARDNLAAVLDATDFGEREVCARINGLQTDDWEGDLRAATDAGVDTIILPMIERPEQLTAAVEGVREASDNVPEFIPTIETPRGLFNADEIAERGREFDRVTGLSYGFGDYTNAIGATGKPASMEAFVRQTVVSAAALGGLDPLATVYQDFNDTEGLREHAAAARELGYIGQKAIHPAQLETLNEMYTPTQDEVDRARRFVDAFDGADRDSIVVDGVFLDTAIVEQYRTVLRRHEEVAG